jgi:hypothetical protein
VPRFHTDASGVAKRQALPADALLQGLPRDELHRHEGLATGGVDIVDGRDIGVIQRGSGPGLLNETTPPSRIRQARGVEKLESHRSSG